VGRATTPLKDLQLNKITPPPPTPPVGVFIPGYLREFRHGDDDAGKSSEGAGGVGCVRFWAGGEKRLRDTPGGIKIDVGGGMQQCGGGVPRPLG